MSIADLTMTSERILGIDFSPSIMNLGIAILYRRPKREPPHMFSFMAYRFVQVLVLPFPRNHKSNIVIFKLFCIFFFFFPIQSVFTRRLALFGWSLLVRFHVFLLFRQNSTVSMGKSIPVHRGSSLFGKSIHISEFYVVRDWCAVATGWFM